LCVISGKLLRLPEIFLYKCYQYSSFAGRNSNVNTATVNPVFLVTTYPIFTCDNSFCQWYEWM